MPRKTQNTITSAEYQEMLKEAKKPKYFNVKTELHDIIFDSQKEAKRYQELLWMERQGLIENIELQPKYVFVVNGIRVGSYKADFRYYDTTTKSVVVEDVKHEKTRTEAYVMRKKLVKALHDVDIVEVL